MENLPLNIEENQNDLYIEGSVLAIFFSNDENFYKVMLIEVEETNTTFEDKEIVIVGNFGQVQEGETYTFYGNLSEHAKYGLQFKATSYGKSEPTSYEALTTYLSGKQFKGIGPKTAEKMVDIIGLDILKRLLDDPSQLDQVPGLNETKKKTIIQIIRQEKGMQHVILKLNEWGINNNLAYKIYGQYKEETLSVLSENPYRLAIDINGIGFNKADDIAHKMAISFDHPVRLKAGLLFSLGNICFQEGNTYAYTKDLLGETLNVLEESRQAIIDVDLLANQLIEIIEKGSIIQEGERLFLPSLYNNEWNIAKDLKRLMTRSVEEDFDQVEIDKEIKKIEEELGIKYGKSQVEAIRKAISSQVFILTGGPGTGKTTVLNGIIRIFASLKDISLDPSDYEDSFPIKLVAPTGRAAKRMNETTGLPASTIHRLLGLTSEYNEDMASVVEISGDLLIVDEMSMVDTWLASLLLSSLPSRMKIVLVGDRDQIPSVGPGQVFRDLMESQTIDGAELTDIYRQDENSSIIPLAHAIKNNQLPSDLLEKKADRSFIPCKTKQVKTVVEKVVKNAISKGYTADEVQVLAPMYKGSAGIDQLNHLVQDLFNPNTDGSRKEVRFIDHCFRIGDKVLQLVNDAEQNVFNGDLGFITSIKTKEESQLKTDELIIDFDGNEITYPRSEWNKITLAYCTSIHKAQGSEYKMVILPVLHAYNRMLKKDLLYTAITRASQFLILLGEASALDRSLSSTSADRKTRLVERLQEVFKDEVNDSLETNQKTSSNVVNQEEVKSIDMTSGPVSIQAQMSLDNKALLLTPKLIENKEIDPMIGMANISFPNA